MLRTPSKIRRVVPFAAAVLAAEVVGEGQTRIELFGFYQKSGAVSLPFL